jgi:hypothetical protein
MLTGIIEFIIIMAVPYLVACAEPSDAFLLAWAEGENDFNDKMSKLLRRKNVEV